jgi:hypothetical protein
MEYIIFGFILAANIYAFVILFNKIENNKKFNDAKINILKEHIDNFHTIFENRINYIVHQKFIELARDYKPYSEEERKEICKAIHKDIVNMVSTFLNLKN